MSALKVMGTFIVSGKGCKEGACGNPSSPMRKACLSVYLGLTVSFLIYPSLSISRTVAIAIIL